MRLPVMPPVDPMLAKAVKGIPEGQCYEPKWDGFRALIFRDGDEVDIRSRNNKPMTRYFPELAAMACQRIPDRCVLDGEVVVPSADGRGLDFNALQQRIHPAASRVDLLAEQTPTHYIAFDLLALDDVSYMDQPFEQRRAALEAALAGVQPPVHVTPVTRDREIAERWFTMFEGAGLDGLIAKRPDGTYQPGKRVMTKVKHERTADCVVAGYRVHKSGAGLIGSLLLGLYDDPKASHVPPEFQEHVLGDEHLVPVGVVGAFPMARRKELFEELQPLVVGFDEHPWRWAAQQPDDKVRLAAANRWNANKDMSFVPLRPERVVEVRYDYLDGHRFRHTAQFVRWRPDRDPESCGFDQLEGDRPEPFDLADVFAGRLT